MFLNSLTRAILATALMLALPATLAAQDAQPEHEHPANQEEVGSLMSQMQEVHQQLEGIQRRALEDPDLNAVQVELGEEIRVAMADVDPTLDQQLARISELETQAVEAQQAGNVQALQGLMSEAQQIQQRFMSVQEQVLDRPQIATKVSDFQTRLESKMIELDPAAEALIVRFRDLESRLNAVMSAGA